jgi:hypothetical protein
MNGFKHGLTRCAGLVERSEILTRTVAWNEVTQANSCQRNKAVIKGVKEIPVRLYFCEDGSRYEEQKDDDKHDNLEK